MLNLKMQMCPDSIYPCLFCSALHVVVDRRLILSNRCLLCWSTSDIMWQCRVLLSLGIPSCLSCIALHSGGFRCMGQDWSAIGR